MTRAERPSTTLPIGIYIHWPYCARICPYCDFAVVRDRGRGQEQGALVDAIASDLVAQVRALSPRRLVSIFFGGGTPSLMAPDAAARLIQLCRTLFDQDQDPVEITLEANPTDAEADRFEAFAEAGVNRLSLGVQALDDDGLRFLGRNHDVSQARRAADLGARIFPRLSLDLIYALPGQTPAAWGTTLRQATEMGAEHISPYELTIEPGTPFDRAVRRGRFTPADGDRGALLYELTQSVLSDLGFSAYEISNHARGRAAQSRHNLIYWRGEDYIGVGPGAHGRVTSEGRREARVTSATPKAYLQRLHDHDDGVEVREVLTLRDAAQERLMMGLRTWEGVALAELKPLALAGLSDLVEQGLILRDEGRIYASAAGRLLLDKVTGVLAE